MKSIESYSVNGSGKTAGVVVGIIFAVAVVVAVAAAVGYFPTVEEVAAAQTQAQEDADAAWGEAELARLDAERAYWREPGPVTRAARDEARELADRLSQRRQAKP